MKRTKVRPTIRHTILLGKIMKIPRTKDLFCRLSASYGELFSIRKRQESETLTLTYRKEIMRVKQKIEVI